MKEVDLTGKKFSRLLVTAEAECRRSSNGVKIKMWSCICDCGISCVISHGRLQSGNTKSCGCIKSEKLIKRNTTHGHSKSRIYTIRSKMIDRCKNKNNSDYKYYGMKGVSVCKEWSESFESFMKWALDNGYKNNLTIDRIDSSCGYSPENCRWISRSLNSFYAKAKKWVVEHPNGKKEVVTSLNKFCKDNGLDQGSACKVANGKRAHHKGYKFKRILL